jgi:hypothetical protein
MGYPTDDDFRATDYYSPPPAEIKKAKKSRESIVARRLSTSGTWTSLLGTGMCWLL